MPPLRGHSETLRSVAFFPSGSKIVSASEDSTIRVWNVNNVGVDEPVIGAVPLTPEPRWPAGTTAKMPEYKGWIMGPRGQLVMWVPPEYRKFLHISQSTHQLIIGKGKVSLSLDDCTLGRDWTKCYRP